MAICQKSLFPFSICLSKTVDSFFWIFICTFSGFVSPPIFEAMLKTLPPNQRNAYQISQQLLTAEDAEDEKPLQMPRKLSLDVGEIRYRYGIVPIHISNMLNNDSEPAARMAGLEKVGLLNDQECSESRSNILTDLYNICETDNRRNILKHANGSWLSQKHFFRQFFLPIWLPLA
jgi:hypothetical protein